VPDRNWMGFGVRGIAPYWISLEATAYLREDGRSAARLRAEYEVMLTQRLVLQPELELNLYDRQDRARALAAGFSDAEFGLRLRYEIRREFAPYVGIVRSYRRTIEDAFLDSSRAGSETRYVIGVRVWL
jgi:copper resistance protein B